MKNNYSYLMRVLLFPLILVGSIIAAGCASTAKPDVPDHVVTVWMSEAVVATFSYDYANYRQQLAAASQYFTPPAWKNYFDALEASGNLHMVIKKKMLASAVPQGAPLILSEGIINGRYSWRIQVPLLITYESAVTHIKQPVVVDLLVIRSDELGVRGLAIDQLVMHEVVESQTKNWQSK